MPLAPDARATRAVLDVLSGLGHGLEVVDQEVLACLAVLGEPGPQRVLDDWLDQVVDTVGTLQAEADAQRVALSRFAGPGHPALGGAHRDAAGGAGSDVRVEREKKSR